MQRLALAQWWLSKWLLLAQEQPKQMALALALLAWQQVPRLAWRQRPVFSRLVLRLVLQPVWQRLVLRLVLRPVWQRQVSLLFSLLFSLRVSLQQVLRQ
jgi:hypothetical protein